MARSPINKSEQARLILEAKNFFNQYSQTLAKQDTFKIGKNANGAYTLQVTDFGKTLLTKNGGTVPTVIDFNGVLLPINSDNVP